MLKDEKLKNSLTPHPLSFFGAYFIPLWIAIWAALAIGMVKWFEGMAWWEAIRDWFGGVGPMVFMLIIWIIGIAVTGIIIAVVKIRWRVFFLYLLVLGAGTGLMFWQGWHKGDTYQLFIPLYSAAVAIVGAFFVEIYRRSHKYYITNLRIIFRGGVMKTNERTLRYDKITDVHGSQSVVGKMLGYGTILPITQSGFGLGADSSFAGLAVGANIKDKVGVGVAAGGGKEVQTPRARSFYELHGVHPYRKIKLTIENLVQESTIAPYQKRQVELQEEMVNLLRKTTDNNNKGRY